MKKDSGFQARLRCVCLLVCSGGGQAPVVLSFKRPWITFPKGLGFTLALHPEMLAREQGCRGHEGTRRASLPWLAPKSSHPWMHRAAAGPQGLSALSQGFPNFPVPLPDETAPTSILHTVSHLGTGSTVAAFPRAPASAKSRPTGHGKLTESKRGGGKAKPIRQLT